MKRLVSRLLLSFGSMLTATLPLDAAYAADPCLQQRQAILEQIDQAKRHGNENRIAGLNRALREQEAHCTPESLRKKREQDVAEARDEVAERERELQEAKREGRDADKIAKREAKLKEAQEELAQAQKALGS